MICKTSFLVIRLGDALYVDVPDQEGALRLTLVASLIASSNKVVLDWVPRNAFAHPLLLALVYQTLLDTVRH